MNYLRKAGLWLLILMMVLSIAACGQAAKGEAKPLRIGLLPDVDSLPFLVAQEEGYFDDAKVQVELVQFKSARDREAAFQAKEIDGCVSDILAAAFMKVGGFDVEITSATDGRYILLAGPDSPIEGLEDFKDQEIAVSQNTIIEYSAYSMIRNKGVNPEDIKMVYIPQIPVRLEMLQQKQVAGACLPDPLATLAVTNGARVISDSGKEGLPPGVMVFHGDIVERQGERVKAMYSAYNRAAEALNERGDDYRAMLTDKAGFPPEVKDVIVFPEYHKAQLPDKGEIQKVLDWMNERKLLDKEVTPEDLLSRLWE